MAVTVTYPLTGGITAPIAAVMFGHSRLKAQVAASADADTAIVITHNWNLSAAELAALQPDIVLTPLTAAGVLSAPTITTRAANSVTITKSTATGSGAAPIQLEVTLNRPASQTL